MIDNSIRNRTYKDKFVLPLSSIFQVSISEINEF